METKELYTVAHYSAEITRTLLDIKFDSEEASKIDTAVELARMVYEDTASVPEKLFARELVEYLCRTDKKVQAGIFTEEEISEYDEEGYNYWKEMEGVLEVFINPRDLFLGGKIRPDVVFRKGKGNYIVFEVDSFQFHSSQDALMKDKIRERKIQSLGYPVYRFAAKEILQPAGAYSCAIEAIEILKNHGFISKEV